MRVLAPSGLLCVLVALAVAGPGRAQLLPPVEIGFGCPDGRGKAEVKAANDLMALPWKGLGRQYAHDAEETLQAKLGLRDLDGKRMANFSGKVTRNGVGLRYYFRLIADKPRLDLNLDRPPGFRAATRDCVAVRAPLEGAWGADFKMGVKGRAKVTAGGTRLFSWANDFKIGFRVSDAHLAATLDLDPADGNRPAFQKGSVVGELTLGPSGPMPLKVHALRLKGEMRPAGLTLVTKLNKVGVNLPGSLGELSFTGELLTTLGPPEEVGGLNFQIVSLSLRGTAKVGLKRVGKISGSLTIPGRAMVVPVWEDVANVLGPLRSGLPMSWGEGPIPDGERPKPPPDGFDFGGQALEIERALGARHLFHGAVLTRSLNRPRIPVPQGARDAGAEATGSTKLSVEADSAIWTGHYLAAEAFRYAATHHPDALARVREVLAGAQRLFDVTRGVVVSDGKRTPVTSGPGILSRTVLDANEASRLEGKPLRERGCYYERPSGGWKLTVGARELSFQDYGALNRELSRRSAPQRRSAQIRPLGDVLYGWGCGGDHAVSRDQYTGILMGLAFTHQLVDDPDVHARAEALIVQALDYLLKWDWNIVLPPDNRIRTTFLGNIDRQLAFLRIGATVRPDKYKALYDRYKAAAGLTWLGAWFGTLDPLSKYYKFNLAHGGLAPVLFLEHDPAVRRDFIDGYGVIHRAVGNHRNAYFDALRILMLRSDNPSIANTSSQSDPLDLTLGGEVGAVLYEWLQRRDDPDVRSPEEPALPLDRLARPEYQLGLARSGKTGTYRTLTGGRRCEANYPISVSGRIAHGMEFVWQRDPFQLDVPEDKCGSGNATEAQLRRHDGANEFPGVDYLLPYWIGAYLGVVPKPAVGG